MNYWLKRHDQKHSPFIIEDGHTYSQELINAIAALAQIEIVTYPTSQIEQWFGIDLAKVGDDE